MLVLHLQDICHWCLILLEREFKKEGDNLYVQFELVLDEVMYNKAVFVVSAFLHCAKCYFAKGYSMFGPVLVFTDVYLFNVLSCQSYVMYLTILLDF